MVVEVENLVKRYGGCIVLDHLNLQVREGEIFGLLGPNGSGKTTVINCILSLLTYDKGVIKLFGDTMRPDAYDIKRQIGVVTQNVAVFDELTVYENILYFCSLYLRDKNKIERLTKEAIALASLLEYQNFYPKKLSPGTLRRLNIACGIAHQPKLIFMDEPTAEVDPQSRGKILEGIRNINKNGATIVYTTHYMEEAEQICTQISIMDQGRVIASGTNQELKNMISLGEKITMEVYGLTVDQIKDISRIKNVYEVKYQENVLKIKSSKGKNNLIHIISYLTERNISFGKLFTQLPTLNDVFLELTGKEVRK